MKSGYKEKITFICFLIAAICFYLSAIIAIISKDGSPWVGKLCLGSAFLCLSTTHFESKRKESSK